MKCPSCGREMYGIESENYGVYFCVFCGLTVYDYGFAKIHVWDTVDGFQLKGT